MLGAGYLSFYSFLESVNYQGFFDFDESSPDEFDSANPYKDPVSMLDTREHTVREKWIDIEKAKIIREKLYWCYCIEGVNHLQKYYHLVH
ncbi:hypothetical protein PRUPE_2G045100 [Prunus persica]|uniref:Uncharacterized protein n=1 Tax=Prunus persica TaxID=3760 RepID=A0A251QB00_PRUPE|nr:hypothetical protein PRUPE_2G045100 [Prunus persica]